MAGKYTKCLGYCKNVKYKLDVVLLVAKFCRFFFRFISTNRKEELDIGQISMEIFARPSLMNEIAAKPLNTGNLNDQEFEQNIRNKKH